MIADPSATRVAADLEDPLFLAGCRAGRWRLLSSEFPILNFAISAIEPDGKTSEYGFRAELTNFPAHAPMVRIWDHASNVSLPPNQRPKGGARVEKTFQHWPPEDTVYRPWDRRAGPHCSNTANLPHLTWRPERRLLFVFEDLYGILHSNTRTHRLRPAA